MLFTPGEHFLPYPSDDLPSLRLNFSHAGELEADRGLEILGRLIREAMENRKRTPRYEMAAAPH